MTGKLAIPTIFSAFLALGGFAQDRLPKLPLIGDPVMVPVLPVPEDDGIVVPVPKKKVVFISDGESWYFDAFISNVEAELKDLALDIYEISFEVRSAQSNPGRIRDIYREVLADPATDLVVAAGVVSTEVGSTLAEAARTRPVLGGAVQFAEVKEQHISPKGTSNLPNYTFITSPRRVEEDLALLRDLSGSKTIYVMVENLVFANLKRVEKSKETLEKKLKVSLIPAPSQPNAASALAAIPPGARAVYYTINPATPPEERRKIFDQLARRKCLVVSMVGLADVKLGAFAGLAPENNQNVERRVAVNAHQILQGIDPRELPVYLPVEDTLVINRRAGNAAGWAPDYQLALVAQFIEDEGIEEEESLTLEQAMDVAKRANADVKVQREQEAIATEDFMRARSFQKPTLDFEIQNTYTDYSSRINPFLTPDYFNQGIYGLRLRQSLFNDSIRSRIAAAGETIAAEKLNSRSRELDAIESAGSAFLGYLSADTLWKVEKENLRLTENNLHLAKLRVDIGAAEISEVYRWQQDAATSRIRLFQNEADRDNARIELNRVLGQPREKVWSLKNVELKDRERYFLNSTLVELIQDEGDVKKLAVFLQKLSVTLSPELAAFDYGLSARGILKEQIRRSYFLPEVGGFASYDRVSQDTPLIKRDSQGEATIGMSLSMPIFEGGLRDAELAGQNAELRQLVARRERALQQIEQRALSSLNGIAAQYPNIELSRRALEAAKLNYAAVQIKYSQGAASILNLLDAQTALLRQEQSAGLAVYSFVRQVLSMQRSMAWFEFEKTEGEKERWTGWLETYLATGELSIDPCSGPTPADNVAERAQIAGCRARLRPQAVESPVIIARPVEEPIPSVEVKRKRSGGLFGRQPQ